MDSADIAWWSLGVAGLALLMSIITSVWQYRDARRRRTPDVVVSARFWPGAGVAQPAGQPAPWVAPQDPQPRIMILERRGDRLTVLGW